MQELEKKILDPCCGSKMFWFDRNNPDVIFADNRKLDTTLCDGRTLIIEPDMIIDFRNMPFSHSENIVNTNFIFSLFHQETVCIKEKNHRKNNHHTCCVLQAEPQRFHSQVFAFCQCIKHIEHHNHQHRGQYIWHVSLPVIFQVCDGKFCINVSSQCAHLPLQERLRCLKSSDTSHLRSDFHDITDETPLHP